jgi:hypothetical protein
MMTSLSLKIDFTATPITGTLEDEDGHKHEFIGWLGLSDVLLRIGDHTEEPATRAHRDGPQT